MPDYGMRQEAATALPNRDRILIREVPIGETTGFLLAIADGLTSCPNGGSVANYLVSIHMKDDMIAFPQDQDPVSSFREYADRLYAQFKAEFADPEFEDMLNSEATLSVVLLHGQIACPSGPYVSLRFIASLVLNMRRRLTKARMMATLT